MSAECASIHRLASELDRHGFPYDKSEIPMNGIYLLFQKGEIGHEKERIVRVGTHTGENQLRSRLKEHFRTENKDRSIFRKNIGRAILCRNKDPFLEHWDLDLTTSKAKEKYSSLINFGYQKKIESQVSQYIQANFTFTVFEVNGKEERLDVESKLISTVSLCEECKPSKDWLGNNSPKEKIVKSGLWLVNQLYKTPYDCTGIEYFRKLLNG